MSAEHRDGDETGGQSSMPSKGTDTHPLPVYSPAEIEQAIAAVPRCAREAFLMHRADGLAYREIALRLGISERRVIRLMIKALGAIRRTLEKIERRRR